jgi:hypothetical protein
MSRIPLHRPLLAALAALVLLGATPSPVPAATLVVNDVADLPDLAPGDGVCLAAGGTCTLRAALEEANALPNVGGPDAIDFDVPGAGPHVIAPSSALPALLDPVVIDGYTQPGAVPNASSVGTDAVLEIVVSGTNAGPADGLDVFADGVTIRGLVVNGWARVDPGDAGSGIRLRGADAVVEGCILGMDPTGTVAVENGSAGVRVEGPRALIGGTVPAARNLISGNVVLGVEILASDTRVFGNLIGADATGTVRMRNGRGIHVGGPGAEIGTLPGLTNLIAGNGSFGIEVVAEGHDARIVGNWIGVNGTGDGELGNGSDGIFVTGAADVAIASNVVAASGRHGIQLDRALRALVANNLIGTDPSGVESFGNGANGILADGSGSVIGPNNVIAHSSRDGIVVPRDDSGPVRITENAIFDNNRSAIDLDGDGLTLNDPLDQDAGANGDQNFPDLATAASDGITTDVTGALASEPNRTYRIEVFANAECDSNGHGEAARLLGTFDVHTDGTGTATFDTTLAGPVIGGELVAATATAPDGSTSEVSACVLATGPATTSTTSPSTTTTLPPTTTTTTPQSSTTTTLPPCTSDAECGDADACTVDSCVDGACTHPVLTGIPGVSCHVTNLRVLFGDVVCSSCSCRFVRRLDKIDRSLAKADAAPRERRCRRGLQKARHRSRGFARKVNKVTRRSCLGPADAALAVVDESAALVTAAEILSPTPACAR